MTSKTRNSACSLSMAVDWLMQNRILRTQRASAASASGFASSDAALPLESLPPASMYEAILRDVGALPGGWACVKSVNPETARDMELIVVSGDNTHAHVSSERPGI